MLWFDSTEFGFDTLKIRFCSEVLVNNFFRPRRGMIKPTTHTQIKITLENERFSAATVKWTTISSGWI